MNERCASPIPIEALHDYFARTLSVEAADELEAHVFSCDRCARAFDWAGELAHALGALIPPVISHARLARLEAAGLVVRRTPVVRDVPARAVFSPEVSLLVHVLEAEARAGERVDVEICAKDGRVLVELPGVPVDRESGEVLIACQRHYQHAFSEAALFRLSAVRGDARRALGDFVVDHVWQ